MRIAVPEARYEFAYLRAADDAVRGGFSPFAGFPDLQEVYRSRELPPFFQNRVMPQGRAEFASHVVELGLDHDASPEAILARTSGRRATDPYEIFAEFEPTAALGLWETRFFARSLRYLGFPEAIDKLVPGQRLLCMQDVQNPKDPKAIALRTDEGEALVGFCPAYLVDDLGPILEEPDAVVVTVERLNPQPAPLQHRLQCHLRVRLREDFHAYRTGRFEPLSGEALRLTPWVLAPRVA